MDEILKLTEEKSNWQFLADGLTQEHQQSMKNDLLRKVDNIQWQIDELERAKEKTLSVPQANELSPHVSNLICPNCGGSPVEKMNITMHCTYCDHYW